MNHLGLAILKALGISAERVRKIVITSGACDIEYVEVTYITGFEPDARAVTTELARYEVTLTDIRDLPARESPR